MAVRLSAALFMIVATAHAFMIAPVHCPQWSIHVVLPRKATMLEDSQEGPAVEAPPPPPDAFTAAGIHIPTGAMLRSTIPKHPEGPERAMSIVSELKNAGALFAAFAFGALDLPGSLSIDESRVTSPTSSISTSRPVPDSDLLQAFVALDAATLGCMLACVMISQLLLYKLADGSYEQVRFGSDESPDPRDSALGRLVSQYGVEFGSASLAFALGVFSVLVATTVKTWAVFDPSVALPVTVLLASSAAVIAGFYVRGNADVFMRLDPTAKIWFVQVPSALLLFGSSALVARIESFGEPGGAATAPSAAIKGVEDGGGTATNQYKPNKKYCRHLRAIRQRQFPEGSTKRCRPQA